MSVLYKNNYITSYNKKEIIDILTGKTSYIPDPYNLQERRKYITLQHFLIKYIEEKGKTKITNDLLSKYYKDFANNPSLFVDSPLIREDFLNRFITKRVNEKVKECRNKYFSSKDIKELYIKLMQNNVLNNQEKNRLYSYLIIKLRSNDTRFNTIIDECAKKILNSNKKVRNLNETELKFFCTYIAKHAGGNVVFPNLHIMQDRPELGGFELENIVYINKESMGSDELHMITKTVCHEVRHAIQEKESKNKNTKTAFEMARHVLFSKYLKSNDYDVYKINYRYSGIELDAEDYGYYYSKVLLSTMGRRDLAEKVRENETLKHKRRHLYEFMIDVGKSAKTTDAFVVEYMDTIIKNHPEELKEYKVLNNLYNEDGSRKSLSNLLAHRTNQGFEDRGLYDNYMNYEIAKNRLFELDLANTKKDVSEKLFKSLGNIYRDKAILFKEYCDDKEYDKVSQKQIKNTTLYQLKLLDNILNFIDQKMNYVLDCKEEKQISNRSFIYDFIYDFRDFNLNNINNEVIKNDPLIKERMNKLLEKHSSIVKKFNEEYIKNKIEDLTIEEKHSIITTPEGYNIQLQDYLYYDILPRLDSHSTVDINGQKVHVSNIIKALKNEVGNQKDNDSLMY